MTTSRPAAPGFAIDLDGVICEIESVLDDLARRYAGRPWPEEFAATPLSRTEWIPDDVLQKIFDVFHDECIPCLRPMPGAQDALKELGSRYRLILLTARRGTSEAATREWLKQHRIPFDALYHVEDKVSVPESLTVAIDDHPRHIRRYLEHGVRCFVMDYPRNRDLEHHPALTRVGSWADVMMHLGHPSETR